MHRSIKRSMFSAKSKPAIKGKAANEIFLYDEIGPWGVTAKEFIAELDAMTAKDISIRINSPGGEVFDANAIYEAIKRKDAKITVHVDGLAASMASIIALAGDQVYIAKGAYMMIHNPWTITMGDAGELRKTADVLDMITGTLAGIYADKSGKKLAEVKAIMAAETWYTAEAAVKNGFATAATEGDVVKNSFDLSIFSKTPKEITCAEYDVFREVEGILREAGYSRAVAKAFIAAGKSSAPRGDAAEGCAAAEKETAAIIAAFTDLLTTISGKRA